ncbi:hypothetical protein BaRGS_00028837, partial [Batillaria attramentaria]
PEREAVIKIPVAVRRNSQTDLAPPPGVSDDDIRMLVTAHVWVGVAACCACVCARVVDTESAFFSRNESHG